MNAKISVIIPVHNSSATLDRCLESVCGNTYENLEIILVENASSDNSLALCNGWADKDGRIKVLSLPEGGVSRARNAGLDVVTGEYFAFVDSDDYVDQAIYSKLCEKAEQTGADMTFCRINYVNADGTVSAFAEPLLDRLVGEKLYDLIFANGGVQSCVWRTLYKSEVFAGLRFDTRLPYAEDRVFLCECLSRANTLAAVADGLYFYVYAQVLTSMYVKYFKTVENAVDGLKITTEYARDFLEKFGYSDAFSAYKYSILCGLVFMSVAERGDAKPVYADGYWKEANCARNYNNYKKIYTGGNRRIRGLLVRHKFNGLIKLVIKIRERRINQAEK